MTNANSIYFDIMERYATNTVTYAPCSTSIAVDPFAPQPAPNNIFFKPYATIFPDQTFKIYSGTGETPDMTKTTNRKMLFFYNIKVLDLRPETEDNKRVVVVALDRSIVVKERSDVRQQIIIKEMKGVLAGVEDITELELVIDVKSSWYVEEKVD